MRSSCHPPKLHSEFLASLHYIKFFQKTKEELGEEVQKKERVTRREIRKERNRTLDLATLILSRL